MPADHGIGQRHLFGKPLADIGFLGIGIIKKKMRENGFFLLMTRNDGLAKQAGKDTHIQQKKKLKLIIFFENCDKLKFMIA